MTDIYRRSRAHRRRVMASTAVTFDWYIDYKNGNDSTGDGSSEAPYKTLSKALTVMSNGESVGVRGTDALDEIYYERNLSTALTDITIQADTGHTPVFAGSAAYTSWAKTGGQTYVYETAITTNCFGVWESTAIARLTSVANVGACDAAEGSYYFDNAGNKLYVHIAGGGSPSQCDAIPSAQVILTTTGSGLTWDGIEIRWVGIGLQISAANVTCREARTLRSTAPNVFR